MLKKVNKRVARKLYDEDTTIILCTSKMYPVNTQYDSSYHGVDVSINKVELFERYNYFPKDSEVQFDTIVNDYKFHNCSYETGYYASYYIEVEE